MNVTTQSSQALPLDAGGPAGGDARDPWCQIDAPDGTAWLFDPTAPNEPWVAFVAERDGTSAVQVAWRRRRGAPSTYMCAICGTGTSLDHCKHTRAAITAYGVATNTGTSRPVKKEKHR